MLALRVSPLLRALSSALRSGKSGSDASVRRSSGAALSLMSLLSIDLALVVHGPKQHSCHLGRAVAGARGLATKGVVELAENVEVDDLPRGTIAYGVERLEVCMDAFLGVRGVQGVGEVVHDIADRNEVLSRELVVVDCLQQGAVGQLHHE
eukprot:scaffold33581_cov62-Phaeocystis_antarctica.AAC.4